MLTGLAIIGLTLFLVVITPITLTFISTRGERFDLAKTDASQVPVNNVGVVLGAGITEDNKPTPYLKSRVDTAVALYKANRINYILMSGDNGRKKYDEPTVMKDYALSLGVPSNVIILDYAGFNTYDSCYRAKAIFKIKSATIITQGYHLPRAMVTCNWAGVHNIGVVAEHKSRDFTVSYLLREVISADKMSIQGLFKPQPTALGKPEAP